MKNILNNLTVTNIAMIAFNAARSLFIASGDTPVPPPWADAPDWQKEAAERGVRFCLQHPDAEAADAHDNWFKEMTVLGWARGERLDAAAKTHPNLVPYEELRPSDRAAYDLFKSVVTGLAPYAEINEGVRSETAGGVGDFDRNYAATNR